MKVKCLPLGGLGRGGTLFLGGRAGMSCFRLNGSSTKPYIKSQWKGEAVGRYQTQGANHTNYEWNINQNHILQMSCCKCVRKLSYTTLKLKT